MGEIGSFERSCRHDLTDLVFILVRNSISFRMLYTGRVKTFPMLESRYIRYSARVIVTCSNDKSVKFLYSLSHFESEGDVFTNPYVRYIFAFATVANVQSRSS